MGLFRRRKTDVFDTGGFGDAHISVTKRRGDVPLIEVQLPQAYALGLAVQAKGEQLGPRHPETVRAAEKYLMAITGMPERAQEARELRAWIAHVRGEHARPPRSNPGTDTRPVEPRSGDSAGAGSRKGKHGRRRSRKRR
jgi:hypothetical protein